MAELLRVENNVAYLDAQTLTKLTEFEKKIKELKEAEDKIKAELLAEMEAKGVIKVDTISLTISYIAPTDRETFDSKRFKAEHADLFDEYVKMSPVKSSVRIKVKE